jgi:hypothetical protein
VEILTKERINIKQFLIFFSKASQAISIQIGKTHPWMKEINVCSEKGLVSFNGDIIPKMKKIGWGNLKAFSRTTRP